MYTSVCVYVCVCVHLKLGEGREREREREKERERMGIFEEGRGALSWVRLRAQDLGALRV